MVFLKTMKQSRFLGKLCHSFDPRFQKSFFCIRLQLLHKLLYGNLSTGSNKYIEGKSWIILDFFEVLNFTKLYSCLYKASWTGVLIFFLVSGKKQIQIPSFKANEGLVLLKTMQFIWMLSYELRSLNPCLVFAIQHRLLVVSWALLFSVFIGTTPLPAEMLQLSGYTTDSTFRVAAKHWNPKTLSQISAAHSSLEKLSTIPAEALPAKSLQLQRSFFSKRPLCCAALNIIDSWSS